MRDNIKAIVGLALIAASVAILDPKKAFPGWWAVLPVAGAFLTISAGPAAWLNRRILSNRAMVSVGLISYPLYLWHWPLLSFTRIVEGHSPPWTSASVAVFASAALAWLTYVFVEKPLRFGKSRGVKIIGLCTALAVVICVGYFTYTSDGFPSRHPQAEKIEAAIRDPPYPGPGDDYHGLSALRLGNRNATSEYVFVGDSNMFQYYWRVVELLRKGAIDREKNSIIFIGRGGCLPVPDATLLRASEGCGELFDQIWPLLHGDSVRKVVLGASWTHGFLRADVYLRTDGPGQPLGQSAEARDHAFHNLSTLFRGLVAKQKEVAIILEMPPGFDPKAMLPTGWDRLSGTFRIPAGARIEDVHRDYDKINITLKEMALEAGAQVITPIDYVCNQEKCPAITNDGYPIYYDDNHFNGTYVRKYATFIDEVFRQPGGR